MRRLVLLVTIATAFGVTIAPAARAQFPGKNGRIAYESNEGLADYEIFSIKPGGSSHQLTSGYAPAYYPSWSPNGKKVCFESDVDGDSEIYRMNADGSNVQQLTHNTVEDRTCTWAPDGKHIAFARKVANDDIWKMRPDGTNQVPLLSTSGKDEYPSYSPNGRRIAFDSDADGDSEIYTAKSGGGGIHQVTHNADSDIDPDWAPNGKRIAYASSDGSDFEIVSVKLDGSGLHPITNNAVGDFSPSYSPNGAKIAYGEVVGTNNTDIFVAKADGSSPVNITHNLVYDDQDPNWQRLA